MQERQLEVVDVLTAVGLLYVIYTGMLSMIQARDVSLCFSGRDGFEFSRREEFRNHVSRKYVIQRNVVVVMGCQLCTTQMPMFKYSTRSTRKLNSKSSRSCTFPAPQPQTHMQYQFFIST
jgi:hypothetical protein